MFFYDDNDNCKFIIIKGIVVDVGEYIVVVENFYGKVLSSVWLVIDMGLIDDEIVSEFEFFEFFGLEMEEMKMIVKEEKIMKYYIV